MRHRSHPSPQRTATFRRMPRMVRLILAALVLFPALAAPAAASTPEGPSTAESLAIADAYWGDHPCAGRVHVIENAAVVAGRGNLGEASGMVADWDGTTWQWRVERCEISVAPEPSAAVRCVAIVHEVGHLVHGPGHEGPMDPAALFVSDCLPAPSTPREGLIRDIRDDLPLGMPWRVKCGPTGRRMRCRTTSTAARYARLYTAKVTDDAATFRLERLIRR